MGIKRSVDELDATSSRPRRPTTKRTKLSPSAEQRDDSSPPSTGSVSEDSALQSSPPASERTQKTSISSIPSDYSDGESESSLDSSESASGSLSDADDDEIVTIGGPKKPRMAHSNVTEGARDLKSRLEMLLPQIAASNEVLLSSEGGASIEDVKEGEQHIEMNLGLGVLEERRDDDSRSASGESGGNNSDEEPDGDVPISSSAAERPWEDRELRVMDTLLGRSTGRQKPGLEDLG